MAHFYLCWELGGGLGHAGRLKSIALPLRARGHRVSFVLRDLVLTRRLLVDPPARRHRAPAGAVLVAPHRRPAAGGSQPGRDPAGLRLPRCGRAGRPVRGLARTVPARQPRPGDRGLRAHRHPGSAQPGSAERGTRAGLHDAARRPEPAAAAQLGTAAAGAAAGGRGAPAGQRQPGAGSARRGAELLLGDHPLLCTWPELDHSARGGSGPWLGPNLPQPAGCAPAWPAGEGRAVFAYLRRGVPETAEVLGALLRQGCRVLCYMPELAGGAPAPLAHPHLAWAPGPVSLPEALAGCELVVSHAGEALSAQALLAGRPLLMLPHTTEGFLMARRVAQLGAGINAMEQARARDWEALVASLLGQPDYRDAAAAFARRYAGFDPQRQAEALADRFEALAAARGRV